MKSLQCASTDEKHDNYPQIHIFPVWFQLFSHERHPDLLGYTWLTFTTGIFAMELQK